MALLCFKSTWAPGPGLTTPQAPAPPRCIKQEGETGGGRLSLGRRWGASWVAAKHQARCLHPTPAGPFDTSWGPDLSPGPCLEVQGCRISMKILRGQASPCSGQGKLQSRASLECQVGSAVQIPVAFCWTFLWTFGCPLPSHYLCHTALASDSPLFPQGRAPGGGAWNRLAFTAWHLL